MPQQFSKKFLWLAVPVLGILLKILDIPEVSAWIENRLGIPQIWIVGVSIIGLLLTYIFGAYRPLVRYEKLAQKRWVVFDTLTEKIKRIYPRYDLRINIMVPRTRFFYFIEPSGTNKKRRKFTLIGKVFEPVWESELHLDRKLRLTINQGLCGLAYRGTEKIIGTRHYRNDPSANFTEKQEELLKNIRIVISLPVSVVVRTPFRKKYVKRAVINLESKHKKSVNLVTVDSTGKCLVQAHLQAELLVLSEIAASLFDD